MKTLLQSVIAAACLVLIAAPAWAQAPGIDVKLNPRIGLYAPLSDLGEAQDAATDAAAEMAGSLAIGLGVELDIFLLPVDVRFNLDYATGSEVSREGVAEASDATLLAVVGDVMFRPLPRVIIAQPYFFVGGGLKQYDFDTDDIAGFQDTSDPTLHVGGGLEVGLGPLALNAEIGDYISWFEAQDAATTDGDSEMQHDLFVTIGFSIGLL